MRRSKLQICIDILESLSIHGPMKLTHVMYKTGLNCCMLREQINFLVGNGLLEERVIRKKKSSKSIATLYAITQQGRNILKSFRELNKLLPVEEEQQPCVI